MMGFLSGKIPLFLGKYDCFMGKSYSSLGNSHADLNEDDLYRAMTLGDVGLAKARGCNQGSFTRYSPTDSACGQRG